MTQALSLAEELSLEETLVSGTNVTIHQLLTDEELALANQQVVYKNDVHTFQHMGLLREVALTSKNKIAKLKHGMAMAGRGDAFVLQLGLCAETMDGKTSAMVKEYAENLGMLVNGLADTLEQAIGKPIIRVVRGAGQFAKPRSVAKEKDGEWTFRGEVTNGMNDRTPNAARLVKAYHFSHLVRENLPENVHASHEALSLAYEVGLDQGDYLGSAPFVWIGNRTNHPDKLHVQFLKNKQNIIGIKVDGDMQPEMLDQLINELNPDMEEGKIALIYRIGVKNDVKAKARPLLSVARKYGAAVLNMCDPAHANVETDEASGKKTRRMSNMIKETLLFAEVCNEEEVPLAGVNVEMSAEDVTECLEEGVTDLTINYQTTVDPCMNAHQGNAYVQKALIPSLQRVQKPVMA